MREETQQQIKDEALKFHHGLLGYENMGFSDGATFGYQLAEQEIAKKDKELDLCHQCLTELYNHADNKVGDIVKKYLDKINNL